MHYPWPPGDVAFRLLRGPRRDYIQRNRHGPLFDAASFSPREETSAA